MLGGALCSLVAAGCGAGDSCRDCGAGVDSGPQDLAPDGPWSCGAPSMTGGAVACKFTWTCTQGQRELGCTYDVVNNEYDCVCRNLTDKTTEGQFAGPSQTCASGAVTVVQAANKACGWKLPGG